MDFPAAAALWFLPFVTPLCLYVALTDLRAMRIANGTVLGIAAIFVLIGPLLFPLETYLWQLSHIPIVLVAGFLLNMGGLMGAGDAKFAAAAAPYVASGDILYLLMLYAAMLLAAFAAHRIARATSLRNLAPDWQSWDQEGHKFPMGLVLGPALIAYLILAALTGS